MTEKNALYELKNKWIQLTVTNIGASIVSLFVKDKNDEWQDIVLGLNETKDYLTENEPSFGSTVGRYANRIKDGQFFFDEILYQLDKNDGSNCLHSGFNRFSTRVWEVDMHTDTMLSFKLISPDGDQGFPGNMTIFATFELDKNAVVLSYRGISDKRTLFNPTNHTYFNLNGHKNDNVLNHSIKIQSHYYMPLDAHSVPLGEKKEVINTPMDFLKWQSIKNQINLNNHQLSIAKGYDHYFLLDKPSGSIEIYSPITGIRLAIKTTLPGFQFYTANFLDKVKGKNKAVYNKHDAFCIETQFCPNGINNEKILEKAIIEKDEWVKSETTWTFDIKKTKNRSDQHDK